MKKISLKQKIVLIIFGIFLSAVLLEAGLRIGGFIYLSLQEYRNIKSLKQGGEYRILCLGESTTSNQWPRPLEDILNQSNLGIKFSVIDKGVSGTNTGAIVTHLKRYLDKYKPHMVVTMMGINDTGNSLVLHYKPDKYSFKSLRIYKFMRLLKLYISEKRRETSRSFDIKTEEMFKKDIKKNPKKWDGYFKLGQCYREQQKYDEAEEMFKKAIEIDPKNLIVYGELGSCYMDRGKFDKAEAVLMEAIEINSKDAYGYIKLGWCYMDEEKFDKAEAVLKEAIKINPKNVDGYIGLGWCYREQRKYDKAEVMLDEAVKIDPKKWDGYFKLGLCYKEQRKYNKALEMYKEVIKINPTNCTAYNEMGLCYMEQRKFDKTEAVLKDAIKINPESEEAIRNLTLYKQVMLNFQGENNVKSLFEYYLPITVTNYIKLKDILTKENIQLVCVQYPILSVGPLRNIFKDIEGMFFVDNEGVFKDALKEGNPDEYFTDMFAGDFGHCTYKGNRLLAQSIADTILEEYFGEK